MLALIGVAAVVLLLGLGLAWLLAGLAGAAAARAGRHGAARSPGGDLDARARVEGSSEQREVASAFNDMTGRLARALRSQREFVANASHQLRTPLTGLRLRLEAASLKTTDPEVERELVAAERETVRLARLLSELLTLARERERPEPEEVSLAEVGARGARALGGPGRDRRPAAGRCAAKASPWWRPPRPTWRWSLDNLVENALNYSPVASTVTIEWGSRRRVGLARRARRGPGHRAPPSGSGCSSASSAARRRAAPRHRSRAVGRGGARRALGRLGAARGPSRGRDPLRGACCR